MVSNAVLNNLKKEKKECKLRTNQLYLRRARGIETVVTGENWKGTGPMNPDTSDKKVAVVQSNYIRGRVTLTWSIQQMNSFFWTMCSLHGGTGGTGTGLRPPRVWSGWLFLSNPKGCSSRKSRIPWSVIQSGTGGTGRPWRRTTQRPNTFGTTRTCFKTSI